MSASMEVRWSGHETEDMKSIGSSLLFPRDAQFDFRLQEVQFSDNKITNEVVRHYGSTQVSLLFFEARKKENQQTLTAPCVVAGLCKLQAECLEEFRIVHLSGKEQRKLGRTVYNQLDWYSVQGCLTCPQCSRVAAVNDECFLIFYGVMQLRKTAVPYVLGGRSMPRLMCKACLNGIARGQIVLGETTTAEELLKATTMLVVGRGGKILMSPTVMGARSMYCHSIKYFIPYAVEPMFIKSMGTEAQTLMNCRSPNRVFRVDPRSTKEITKRKIEAGVCFACLKPAAAKICSRCKKIWYCSKECQRKDWKRHKVSECIAP